MTVDYAKKTKQAPNTSRRLLFLSIVILALAAAFLIFMLHLRTVHHNTPSAHPPITAKKIKPTQPMPTITKSQFDFYSMLPNMKVDVKSGGPHSISVPKGHPYFLLQVATTSNQQEAQTLITKLGVMGLNAFIKPYQKQNGQQLYRIVVGPYLTQREADTNRAYLTTNHINSLKLKLISDAATS